MWGRRIAEAAARTSTLRLVRCYGRDEAKLQSRKIRQLPGSLAEALDELAADEVIRDALGDHVFERFVEAKREEWDEYRMQVSGWETAR